MSSHALRPTGRLGGSHPAVRARRAHDAIGVAVMALVPLAAGLAITAAFPQPNPLLFLAALVGVLGIAFLLTSERYEVTLALVVLYLGVLDGPVKLLTASKLAAGARDVLILAVVLGMLMRLVVRRQPISFAPLSRWVLAFVAFVAIDALNPHTGGILKVLGGYRQQLEWVPFFFFGYMLMRDKERFRKLFLLIGVIALANGIVGTVQSRMGVAQVASWGPGYRELAYGGEGSGLTGRTFSAEGEAHLRPPALGSDAGFGGTVGALALPLLLALLAISPPRRQWLILLLCAGAVLGIATSASRTQTVVGVVGLLSFGGVSLLGGVRLSRALMGIVAALLIVSVVVSLLLASSGAGLFSRQKNLTNIQSTEEHGGGKKVKTLTEIPHFLVAEPFGYGLGVAAAASGFGGTQRTSLEGERVASSSAYGLLMKELGAPGLLLWVGLTINTLILGLKGLRRIPDVELRTLLAGLMAAFIALTIAGLSGPTLAVPPGAFLWGTCGIVAYWFGLRRHPTTTEAL